MFLVMCWFWEQECGSGFWGGCAGDITSVDADLLRTLVHDGYIPVVASVAADQSGQSLNVNADIAAGEARPPRQGSLCSICRGCCNVRARR